MEYLDFSSVITTIRNYISDAHSMNQIDMMYQLFVSFLSSDESLDFDFDNGLVCRWFNGQAKISPRITRYYMDNHNRNRLAADMHRNVLPLMYDSMNTVNDLIEKGFIKAMEGRMIALHPMMQEVTMEETKPSVQTCHTLLESLQQICLRHGEEPEHLSIPQLRSGTKAE